MKFLSNIGLVKVATDPSSPIQSDVWFNTANAIIKYYDGTNKQVLVAEALAQALTNKTINAVSNTITNIAASNMSLSANSMLVNNTGSTAAPTEITFVNKGVQSYTGTLTWDGTPPATLTNAQYQWIQHGKLVHFWAWFDYNTVGVANTNCDLTFPADLPLPFEARTGTSNILYDGIARVQNSLTGTGNQTRPSYVIKTGTGTYKFNISMASVPAKSLEMYMTYISQ